MGPARIERRADGQPGQIGGQHDGEGEGACAHEGHDHLRPDHFVAQRHRASHRVQRHGQARLARQGRRSGLRIVGGRRAVACPAVQHPGGQRRQHVERGRGQRRTLHAEARNQEERGQQCAQDRAAGIRGIHRPARAAHVRALLPAHGAQQHRQGAAHQKCGDGQQQPYRQPGRQAAMGLDRDKGGGAARQQPCHGDTGQRHARFQHGVEAYRAPQLVRLAAQQPAAQRQAQEECADSAGDGADLHAHHQRQLLDPQHLEHQGRRSGQEQQRGRPDRRQGAPLRRLVVHIMSLHRCLACPHAHHAAPAALPGGATGAARYCPGLRRNRLLRLLFLHIFEVFLHSLVHPLLHLVHTEAGRPLAGRIGNEGLQER
ncbi:hypothetical protein LMG3410_06432 [Achromobacter aegrifaciens]|nr:hypothetical protein LMG3410_06432 [Achromobacter aegrifaciens]